MAHLVDNMAYIGTTPWHGLGKKLSEGVSLDQWRIEAGLNWSVDSAIPQYDFKGELLQAEGKLLHRSDNGLFLSHVSDRYNVVQPATIVEFYRDLCATKGFKIETMGSLNNSRKIWALANTGEGFVIGKNDTYKDYLLLATSYDKTMSTQAMFTSIRVVCNNTLGYAVNGKESKITVSHSTQFNPAVVAKSLGLQDKDAFVALLQAATKIKVTKRSDAVEWINKVMFDDGQPVDDKISTRKANIIQAVFNKFNGCGRGSSFETARGTEYGLLQAVTEYVDHTQGRTRDSSLNSAWFGNGATIKNRAWQMVQDKIAA